MKKVYEPGEKFHEAYYAAGIPLVWERYSKPVKDIWALRERHMMGFFPELSDKDEQTDDSAGVFVE